MMSRYRALLVLAALSLPVAAVHAQASQPLFSEPIPDPGSRADHSYRESLAERREVATFNRRLAAADKLTSDQVERLRRLLWDVNQVPWNAPLPLNHFGVTDRLPMNPQFGGLWEQQRYLASLEASLRTAEERADLLLERLPRFLTARQILAFAALEAERLTRHRAAIESTRHALGLSIDDGRRRSSQEVPVL
jgi:hypothetical protein